MGKSRVLHCLTAILLLLSITGCTTKIGYNYASWWANWAIDDYISLNRDQKKFFKQEFKQLHKWHRETQLPLYADYLDQLIADLETTDMDPDHLRQRSIEAQQLIDLSKEKAVAPFAELLASLNDRQVEKLIDKLQKQSEEYREDYVEPTAEKRIKARSKSMRKYAKSWLGSLDSEQKSSIVQWSEQLQPVASMELENQYTWQQQFATVMEQRQEDAAAVSDYLNHYLFNGNEQLSEEHRDKIRHNQQLTRQLIADLLTSLSDKQQRHISKELRKLSEDFRELSAD